MTRGARLSLVHPGEEDWVSPPGDEDDPTADSTRGGAAAFGAPDAPLKGTTDDYWVDTYISIVRAIMEREQERRRRRGPAA